MIGYNIDLRSFKELDIVNNDYSNELRVGYKNITYSEEDSDFWEDLGQKYLDTLTKGSRSLVTNILNEITDQSKINWITKVKQYSFSTRRGWLLDSRSPIISYGIRNEDNLANPKPNSDHYSPVENYKDLKGSKKPSGKIYRFLYNIITDLDANNNYYIAWLTDSENKLIDPKDLKNRWNYFFYLDDFKINTITQGNLSELNYGYKKISVFNEASFGNNTEFTFKMNTDLLSTFREIVDNYSGRTEKKSIQEVDKLDNKSIDLHIAIHSGFNSEQNSPIISIFILKDIKLVSLSGNDFNHSEAKVFEDSVKGICRKVLLKQDLISKSVE